MAVPDARRLAAADMWGRTGSLRRRRLIRAEFVLGVLGCIALGAWSLVAAGSGVWIAVGVWLIGIGANYVALSLHAESLARPGRLEDELRDLDLTRELRRAGRDQLWIVVPFALALAELRRASRPG